MSNPRGVNWLQDPAHVLADEAVLPAIPELHTEDRELQAAHSALKRNVEVIRGVPGLPGEAAVRKRELQELGLTGSSQPGDMPPDHAGFPVWAGGARRFEMVTPQALATVLAQYLASEGEVTRDEFTLLRQAVAAIEPGVSRDEVMRLLHQLAARLAQAWAEEISQALTGQNQQVNALSDVVAGLSSTMHRLNNGFVLQVTTAAAVWTVRHNLGRRVAVTALDTGDEEIHGQVVHTDLNTVVLTHSSARKGWVICR